MGGIPRRIFRFPDQLALRFGWLFRFLLLQKLIPATRGAKEVFPVIEFQLQGVFQREIGVANFILDHDPRNRARRPRPFAPAGRAENEADGQIEEVSKKEIKNQAKKAATHSLTLNNSSPAVNRHPVHYERRLILHNVNSKIRGDLSRKEPGWIFYSAKSRRA